MCGGWLTPEVLSLLDLNASEYRAAGLVLQEITGFHTGLMRRDPIDTRYPGVVSYAIRRCEFDDFLLRRARVNVLDYGPALGLSFSADLVLRSGVVDRITA